MYCIVLHDQKQLFRVLHSGRSTSGDGARRDPINYTHYMMCNVKGVKAVLSPSVHRAGVGGPREMSARSIDLSLAPQIRVNGLGIGSDLI